MPVLYFKNPTSGEWQALNEVGPVGPLGPTGPTGPTGPVSTVPGPTGPVSTVPGPTGPTGPISGLAQGDADLLYVNVLGDTMLGELKMDVPLAVGVRFREPGGAERVIGMRQGNGLGIAVHDGAGNLHPLHVGSPNFPDHAVTRAWIDAGYTMAGSLTAQNLTARGTITAAGAINGDSHLTIVGDATFRVGTVNGVGITYPGFTNGPAGGNRVAMKWATPNIVGGVDNVNNCVLGTVSARKWKRGISSLKGALAKVKRLRPVEYTAKDIDGSEHGRHHGLVADEVRRVLPGAVTGDDEDGSVNYQELVPTLIAAVQELSAEVDALKAQRAGAA